MRSIVCPTENSLSPNGRGSSSFRADCCSQIHSRDRSPQKEEIATRTYAGFYLLTTPAYNEEVLRECGLRILTIEDITHTMAESADHRRAARAARESESRTTEGDHTYGAQQNFLVMVARLRRPSLHYPARHLRKRHSS